MSVNVLCRGSTTGDSKIWGLTGDAGDVSTVHPLLMCCFEPGGYKEMSSIFVDQ
jgi:hypothetical protein